MFVAILALVLLVSMWMVGEQEFRTKLILTAVHVAVWGMVFVPHIFWLAFSAMCLWCIVVGYWTFGSSFGKK